MAVVLTTPLGESHKRPWQTRLVDAGWTATIWASVLRRILERLESGFAGPAHALAEVPLLLLSTLVGALFLFRSAAQTEGCWRAVRSAIPTVMLGAISLHVVPPTSWTHGPAILTLCGAALCGWAFLTLGKSFAVFPARREIVFSGPYRWVRHPAYSAELLIVASAAWAVMTPWMLGLLVLTAGLIVPRIWSEEALLLQSDDYKRYKRRTPWRLAPRLY